MLPIVHAGLLQHERLTRARNLCLLRTRRSLRVNNDPFTLSENRFVELYRIKPFQAEQLIDLLGPHLPERKNTRGISIQNMVLVTLRFLATGSYQRCLGEEYNFGMSQTTVGKYVRLVVNVIHDNIIDDKIQFPNTREERNEIKMAFLNRWGFPGCIGAIDGTHIAILKPKVDPHLYLNRKGFHSINVQMICDHKLKVRNVLSNFGGASHDSFIWRQSQINDYLNNVAQAGERSWLIGDSGYPLSEYLMTPFRNPGNRAETRFNETHSSARNVIERCFGVLKMRFRCLLKEHTARYDPEFLCKLVKVCAALHNICIDGEVNFEGNDYRDDNDEANINGNPIPNANRNAINLRQNIVNNYFI